MLFVLLVSCIALTNAHMSMSFPVPRSYGRVSRTDCNSAKRAQKYLTWEWNEPMVGVRPCICHGTFPDATIPTGNVFPAGSTITVKLAGSAFHNGGHCSFWWSTDGKNFKKFVDYKDCTTDAVQNRPINIVIPKGIDAACGTRCIFAWTWVPVSSGACEVYMTCADVQITGATGGFTPVQTKDFSTVTPSTCVRVNGQTISTLFCPATYGNVQNCIPATPAGTTTTSTTTIPITAPPKTTTTQGTGTNSPIGALCPNPGTPTNWGNINNQNGRCGNGVGSCDVGHCCSAAGFCGPDLRGYANGLPQYINYTANPSGTVFYPNAQSAFADYCTNPLADFRQVPCCAIVNGAYNSNLNSCLKSYTPLTTTTTAAGGTTTAAGGTTTTGSNTTVLGSGVCLSGWMAFVAAFVGFVLV